MNDALAEALFFEAGGVVPVAALRPDDAVIRQETGVDQVVAEEFWWPSDAVQEVWVPLEAGLSQPMAAMITAEARARVMAWIGGVSLHPVEIYDRFANGCFLHGCGDSLVPDGLEDLIMRNRDARWRGLMNAIFGTLKAKERNALENEIHGVLLAASKDGKLGGRNQESGVRGQTWFECLENQSTCAEQAQLGSLGQAQLDADFGGEPPADLQADSEVFRGDEQQSSSVVAEKHPASGQHAADPPPAGQASSEVFGVCSRELLDWAAGALLEFLAASGTDPFRVVQRFYGLCFYRYKSVVGKMNGRDLAGIMSQGRAQFSAMEKRVFTDPIEWITGVVEKVDGQKGAESCGEDGVYAENARRNKPRQMLGGQAGSAGLDLDLDRALKSDKAQRRLNELRAAAEARAAVELDDFWEGLRGSAHRDTENTEIL